MKHLFTLLLFIGVSHYGLSQAPIQQNLRVDSLYSEMTDSYRTPEHAMHILIKDGKLTLSGYNLYMEEGKSTTFSLAQEIGNGEKKEDYTYYSSSLYFNNPSPDCTLIIYEYKDNIVKLVIETNAFITRYYCTKED